MPVILVVDDNPQMAKLLQEIVELAGFEAEVAFSGLDGLDKVRDGMPDLILVDVMMPKMDGWQVYQKIREFSSIPVIFVTAYDTPQNQIRAIEIGAEGYMSKDQIAISLVQQIQFVLESAHMPPSKDYFH
ncbi:MAG: response regulator [Chloroflexi bacterium]|nr:response regulator [Chloroflexota bacterium]